MNNILLRQSSPQGGIPRSRSSLHVVMMGERSVEIVNVHPDDVRGEMVCWGSPVGQICHICPEVSRISRLRRHVVGAHLPWFVRGWTACQVCHEQCLSQQNLQRRHANCLAQNQQLAWVWRMIVALHYIRQQFGLQNLSQLLQLVIVNQWYPAPSPGNVYNSPFSEYEQTWLI